MNILQVSTQDIAGGAEKIAMNLHKEYRSEGHRAILAVGRKISNESGIIQLSQTSLSDLDKKQFHRNHCLNKIADNRISSYLLKFVHGLSHPQKSWDFYWGKENFSFPDSHLLLSIANNNFEIINFHNLHGDYFDLRILPSISKRIPAVITMHDEWLYTGHCAYSFDCMRWKNGCGNCPDLGIYPPIKRDSTRFNLKRKQGILLQSPLFLVTPSKWLMDRLSDSILANQLIQVIHNGIDLNVFSDKRRQYARHKLGITEGERVILSLSNRSYFKDFPTIFDALNKISAGHKKGKFTCFIVGGQQNKKEYIEGLNIHYVDFQSNQEEIALYYQAADLFLFASKADNYPTTILESLACGTPVIATNVGGIPEQIIDGENGFLVPKGDSDAMALLTNSLLEDFELRNKMGMLSAERAKREFGIARQCNDYLRYYEQVIMEFNSGRGQ